MGASQTLTSLDPSPPPGAAGCSPVGAKEKQGSEDNTILVP